MTPVIDIPSPFREDVEKAISILKKHGASEIYIFGSIADGSFNDNSDIDIAVRGIRPELYLKACADITFIIDRKVDLLNMDTQERFVKMLERRRELIRVA